jgi:hypothetical protein
MHDHLKVAVSKRIHITGSVDLTAIVFMDPHAHDRHP